VPLGKKYVSVGPFAELSNSILKPTHGQELEIFPTPSETYLTNQNLKIFEF